MLAVCVVDEQRQVPVAIVLGTFPGHLALWWHVIELVHILVERSRQGQVLDTRCDNDGLSASLP